MIILDDIKIKLKSIESVFLHCKKALNVDLLKNRLKELEIVQTDPNLFGDPKKAQKVMIESTMISKQIETLKELKKQLDDTAEFISLAESEKDDSLVLDIKSSLESITLSVDNLYLSTLLNGTYDNQNAILSLHAGAGGTEAQDWVSMLYRMFKMYAGNNGFKIDELDYLAGDEAGIKSVSFRVSGLNAYGYLKAEKGVHRLVRISPFDSNARRHTSFASVEVMPEIENDTTIVIKDDELKIDTYRAGGAGGQHVNKTESAVRITHLPTGIVVQCQNERSQIQNKETALKMLKGKLIEKRERENTDKAGAISGELKKIEWGSQIRSYVFQPYTMVKDHRTNFENTDVAAVMNGKIESFIFEYLRRSAAAK